MSRNIITRGIILKTVRFGEIHKSVTLVSPEAGILHAVAHGALKMKSRLRSSTQLFSNVKAYIYHDPVKDSYKITDIETINQFFGIAESIEKFYASSLFSEIVLKSWAGGESAALVYSLLLEAFSSLDRASVADVVFVIIQFIYRYLEINGSEPQLRTCSLCDKMLYEAGRVYFFPKAHIFLCPECAGIECIPVSRGMLKYMEKTVKLPFQRAMEVRVENSASAVLKSIMYDCIESLLDSRLASIRSAGGII